MDGWLLADPKPILLFWSESRRTSFSGSIPDPQDSAMFVIEALHTDGWRIEGHTAVEYWAQIEAQTRCCSDGRTYRIRDEDNERVLSLVETSCCRALINCGN
ncbi:MAG: hypothetical protein KXJ50_03570 [Vulcanococcus sp.]|uniref:hypothetical protein n=1 Tax=Vulcanococcus sp. TaxID=2856995 RepID=UPI0025ED1C9B|nr:hypothetical protein [Vulcanococcus sp.]MBW0173359.1 hypothetical protein [Vulcanococcus sp.]MBW0180132.1 hypothetical protein [Vulcanococcus sp.]